MTAAARQRRSRERRYLRSRGYVIPGVAVRRELVGMLTALRLIPIDVGDDLDALGRGVPCVVTSPNFKRRPSNPATYGRLTSGLPESPARSAGADAVDSPDGTDDGAGGADTLQGGKGNDYYYVDHAGDKMPRF